jgi:biotin--protein ligase
VSDLLPRFKEILTRDISGDAVIRGENDTFHVKGLPASFQDFKAGSSSATIADAVSSLKISPTEQDAETSPSSDRIVDYDKVVKQLIVHTESAPSIKETPSFNHAAFYANLHQYTKSQYDETCFGKYLLYGEVITSTSTILEK